MHVSARKHVIWRRKREAGACLAFRPEIMSQTHSAYRAIDRSLQRSVHTCVNHCCYHTSCASRKHQWYDHEPVSRRVRPDCRPVTPNTASKVDSDSIHTTPSLRGHEPHGKTDVDSHFHLESPPSPPPPPPPERQDEPSSAPPYSSHDFPPSRYFNEASVTDPCGALEAASQSPDSLPVFEPSGPAPPFEEPANRPTASSVVADTKAALPRDTKDGQSSKDVDDGEPPPPYTEGSSPLEGFTYVMAAAGGAASIITQVQQGGPAPINTALGGIVETSVCALRSECADNKHRVR